MVARRLTIVQMLPALEVGGVEQGTVEIATELVRRGHRSLVVSAPGRMVAALTAAGSQHLPWAIGVKSPFSLRWVRPLRRLFHEYRVDVVHARSRLPAWIGYRALATMAPASRPAFVTTVHGPYTVNRYSAIMTRGDTVIAVSQFIREYIERNYPHVDPTQVEVIERGVSAEEYPYGYRPSDAWSRDWADLCPQAHDKFVVTLPARITRWKGQEDFIEVIAKLLRRGVPVHGLIAGGAEPRRRRFLQKLESAVTARGLDAHVTFLGQRQDLRDIMAISDAVLSLPRVPEAFGRTTLEALRLGRPVVGYDHGGTREILAAMFPEGACPTSNPDAVAARLAEFHDSPPDVPDRPVFQRQEMLDKTLAVYERLASRSAPVQNHA